jgi:archaetidylinositol phosphate synthase
LLGRADRLALVGLVTAVAPAIRGEIVGLTLVGWLLVVFAIVGHLTALQRFYGALGALS